MGKKGGSSQKSTQTNSYDPKYTAKLTEVADWQMKLGKSQWKMYEDFFKDYDIAAAKANEKLLPLQTGLEEQRLKAQKPIAAEYYKQALGGVDVGERMDRAGAEVVNAMKLGGEATRRDASRMGLNPNSSTFANAETLRGIETAKGVAGERTKAKTIAEDENFNRLGGALGFGVASKGAYDSTFGTADPYARASSGFSGAASTYAPLATRVLSSTSKQSGGGGGFGSFLGSVVGMGVGAMTGGIGTSLGASLGNSFFNSQAPTS